MSQVVALKLRANRAAQEAMFPAIERGVRQPVSHGKYRVEFYDADHKKWSIPHTWRIVCVDMPVGGPYTPMERAFPNTIEELEAAVATCAATAKARHFTFEVYNRSSDKRLNKYVTPEMTTVAR